MSKKLIDLHWEWMKHGRITSCGLCNSLPNEYLQTFDLFKPSEDELVELEKLGLAKGCISGGTYWASDIKFCDDTTGWMRDFIYGETRQTIVLFICAMHDEL